MTEIRMNALRSLAMNCGPLFLRPRIDPFFVHGALADADALELPVGIRLPRTPAVPVRKGRFQA